LVGSSSKGGLDGATATAAAGEVPGTAAPDARKMVAVAGD
jgi:hypothetical protein